MMENNPSQLKISTMTGVARIYDKNNKNNDKIENEDKLSKNKLNNEQKNDLIVNDNVNNNVSDNVSNDSNSMVYNTKTSKVYESNINLDILTRFINIYDVTDKESQDKNGCLTNISYFSNLPKTFNIKDYQVYKKNPFFNQSTSIFSYYGCRNINTKIFNNGMLQMTGIQSQFELEYISKCIINILKETKIKIYLNSKKLPKTKINNKYLVYYNTKTNNLMFYRWNYLELFSEIETALKIKLYSQDTELNTLYNTYKNKWVPESIISKYIQNLIGYHNKLNEKLQKLLFLKNNNQTEICLTTLMSNNIIEHTNTDNKEVKININDAIKETNQILNYIKNINKKLSIVHTIDCTIVKSMMLNYKEDLQDLILEETLPNNIEYNLINDTQNLKLNNTKIELINSDFCVNFIINNTKLHQIIKSKYKIFSSYEPNDYPGVKNKFCWNINNLDNPEQGICSCSPNCVERGKKSICVQITISVFQSGSIIITGAKNIKQIKDAYNFKTKILNDNYDEIKGKNNNEQENIKIQEKINNNRKIMRKNQLYFIKKENIDWSL